MIDASFFTSAEEEVPIRVDREGEELTIAVKRRLSAPQQPMIARPFTLSGERRRAAQRREFSARAEKRIRAQRGGHEAVGVKMGWAGTKKNGPWGHTRRGKIPRK